MRVMMRFEIDTEDVPDLFNHWIHADDSNVDIVLEGGVSPISVPARLTYVREL